jgi:hypothetical protein
MLSGSNTPLESMPAWLATVIEASPSTHFVSSAQSILFRGAGIDAVWPEFLATPLLAACSLEWLSCASAHLSPRPGDQDFCAGTMVVRFVWGLGPAFPRRNNALVRAAKRRGVLEVVVLR